MKRIALALGALLALTGPIVSLAQTLPPSTQDRQTIANLEYQANLPGTSPSQKAEIQRQVTALQYQISTRPPIAPMPTLAPQWNGVLQQTASPMGSPGSAPLVATVYGSCAMNRAVIAYLAEQIASPAITAQERDFDRSRSAELARANARCPQ